MIDLCFHIVESGALLYVAPSRCSSRDAEIQCEAKNKQKQLLTLEQGTLKSVSADALPMVDVGTEMKLMYAFQRRGLAFDLVGLLSWDAHTEWTNKLFRALMADAPADFLPIGLQQIIKADQEMFILLSSEYEGPLKATAIDGEPPLDAQIRMLMNDPRVNVFLVPMPSHQQKRPAASTHGPDRPVQPPTKKPKPGGKAPAQIPSELANLHTKTGDNKPLCWSYNLQKGCTNTTEKGRCRFGYHTCMKCLKPGHGAHKCNAS